MGNVKELHNTRALSVGEGAATLRKSYMFQGYTDERSVTEVFGQTVVNDDSTTTVVPFVRGRHSQFDPDGWPFLFCYKFDLVKMPGSNDTWRVDYEFRSIQPPPLTTNNNSVSQGPEEVGFEELTGRVTGSFDNVYRVGFVVADGASIESDIGGKGVDVAGTPTSTFRSKYEIQLSKTSFQQFDREIASYGAQVGTRTSRELFGIDAGFLLYQGANVQRITHNSYRVSHTWLFDEFAHLIQAPLYTANGGLPLNDEGRAETVYAVQPFDLGDSHLFAK